MNALNKTSKVLLVLSLAIGLATGCTKKRPDQFAQTQGIDAQKVSDVRNWSHTLQTKAAVYTPNKTVAEKDIEINSDLKGVINNYPLVDYSTNSDLLGEDIPLRGKTNHSYQLRYELGDTLLRILKVDRKENIPSEEWPYAVQLEDGLIGVPLVGYNVSYFEVDHALNEDRKRTSTLIEKPVKDPTEASYVRINRASRQIFEAIQKVDVFPADYFKGEWYYQMTIVETGAQNAGAIASVWSTNRDTQLQSVQKVRIDLQNRNTLLAVNVNQDKRLESQLDEGYVFSIPIQWKEFEASRSGRGQGLRENSIERRTEIERPYIQLRFEEHFSTSDVLHDGGFAALLLQQATGDQKLVDVKLAKDYFSFTLLKANQGLKIRYSLRRNINSTYKDVRDYNQRDFETFGYYYSTPRILLTRDFQRQDDLDRLSKMNRFNPDAKEIVYHFSKESPQDTDPRSGWVREIGRYAVHFWDQAFQKAGVNIRIRLDESKDVDLGDLRYNVLHIINPINSGGLGGYGPSVADPETGEIISATSNIIVNTYADGMAAGVRNYIRNGLHEQLLKVKDFGKGSDMLSADSSVLFGVSPLMMDKDGQVKPMPLYGYENRQVKEVVSRLTPQQENLLARFLRSSAREDISKLTSEQKIVAYHDMTNRGKFWGQQAAALESKASLHNHAHFSNGTTQFTKKRIQRDCPAVDRFVTQAKRNGGEYNPEVEVQIVEDCVKKLIRLPVLHTLVHEMGHNFSLVHNFKCSADPGSNGSNFFTADEIRREYTGLNGSSFPDEFLPLNQNPMSSCVMDYLPDNNDLLPVPGKYDIAAIRFIYGGKVEMADGKIKPLYTTNQSGKKEWKTINDSVGKGALRPLAYCSDYDAGVGFDPLCKRHDYGRTPEEIVDYTIASYWNDLQNTTYTYDRYRTASLSLSSFARQEYYMNSLKRIYDEWRIQLGKFLGPNQGYLDSLNNEQFAKKLEEMSKSQFAKQYALYKPARDKIVNFFIQVAFMADRYCVGKTASGSLKGYELHKAIKDLTYYGSNGAISCGEQQVQDVLRKQGFVEYLTEIGKSFENYHFSNTPRALQEAPDVWGVAGDRIGAITLLVRRVVDNTNMANGKTFPAMLDEPDVRQKVFSLFQKRLFEGMDVSSYLKNVSGLEGIDSTEAVLRNFKVEQPFLTHMVQMIPAGLHIPEKPLESRRLLNLFSVQSTNNVQLKEAVEKQGAAIYTAGDGIYFFALPNNQVSYSVIQNLLASEGELELYNVGVDKEAVASVYNTIVEKFPQENNELSLMDLFEIVNVGFSHLQNSQLHPSVQFVIQKTMTPYLSFIGSASNGQLQQIHQAFIQVMMKIAELESPGVMNVDAEKMAELGRLKQQELQMREQFKTMLVGKVLAGLPNKPATKRSEFQAAVESALGELIQLSEQSVDEIRAHQEVLNTAIRSW